MKMDEADANIQNAGCAIAQQRSQEIEEQVLAEIEKYGRWALEYVPKGLRTERMCLAAVIQDGCALEYVPDSLRTEEICLAAVKQSGYALEYVPEYLRTEEMCLEAVKQDGRGIQYVPDSLRTEEM